jgi:hypothetical protein
VIVPEKCRFGTENNEANQALAGQFPLQTKPECFRLQSGIKYAEPGIAAKNVWCEGCAPKQNQKQTHRSARRNAIK